jgi:hypothetical protein
VSSKWDYFEEAHGAKQTERERITNALNEMGFEALYDKGGFWIKGHGHISFAYAWLKAFCDNEGGQMKTLSRR